MKPMIWKELRENIQWVVLSMIALGLAYAFEVHQGNPEGEQWMFSHSLYPASGAIFAPIVGVLLGLLQIVPELRRDQWAFLVHRPVSRTMLFWGKAVPGLLLYLLATIIPMLGATFWIVTHITMMAPFDWRMLQGGIADILAGVLFYFAGLLTALRPARWYGSRTLPIFAAVLFGILLYNIPSFQWTLTATLLTMAIFLIATWGSFVNFGEYRGQSKSAKAALGLTLFVGILAVGTVAVATLVTYVAILSDNQRKKQVESQLNSAQTIDSAQAKKWIQRYYAIDKGGKIVRVEATHFYTAPEYLTAGITTVTDLDGKPVHILEKGQPVTPQTFLQSQAWLNPGSLKRGHSRSSYRYTRSYYQGLSIPNRQAAVSAGQLYYEWFYSEYQRRVLGYSRDKEQVVGYIGPGGFYPTGASHVPSQDAYFKGRLLKQIVNNTFWFTDGVYLIEPENQRVTRFAADESGHRIRDVSGLPIDKSQQSLILVLTDQQIEVFSMRGVLKFTIPLAQSLSTHPDFLIYTPPGQRLLIRQSTEGRAGGAESQLPDHITEVSLDGNVLNRYTLPPLRNSGRPADSYDQTPYLLALTAPVNAIALITTGADALGIFGMRILEAEAIINSYSYSLRVFKTGVLASFFYAVLMYFITRRYVMNRRAQSLWIGSTLLLGPAGILLLLALREWPARIPCPACTKRRDVHREFCEHCGATFPQPTRDGTEIFA